MKMIFKRKRLMLPGLLSAGMVLSGCFVGDAPVRAQGGTEAAKTELLAQIKGAGTFAEEKYSFATWNDLRAAMNAARQIVDKAGATPDELQGASSRIQAKIVALQERPVLTDQNPRIGLSASPFATNPRGPINSVALLWATADPSDSFEIQRAAGKSRNFSKIYLGKGTSFNDYNLPNGTHSYRLITRRDGKTLASSIEQVSTMALPPSAALYSNQTGSGGSLSEPLKVGDTFYRFDAKRDGKTVSYTVATSFDGKNWKNGPVVLDAASHPDLDDFKFEAGTTFYDKKRDRIVWWCHYERSGRSYSDGRAFVATAKPGERFTVHRIFNPLGIEVRDMSVFRDDDGQGYLVAASNLPGQGANATLYIFKMNADYTDITGITNKVMEGGYREAPHIIKVGGFYYFFFSQAAGWYPSRAAYVSARSLDGRWSDARYIGNPSTFSAQSGGIVDYGNGQAFVPVLLANRWIRGEGTSANSVLPLHCADGFAFGDYSPTLIVDPKKDLIVPLHAGKLLSQDKPATASIAGNQDHEVGKAFDGDYTTSFVSDDKKWPFSVTTDLGVVSHVRNVQISWHIHKGSEAFYLYTIEGSTDGQQWRVLLNRTDDTDTRVSKTYGFSSDLLLDAPAVRYVRINVDRAVLHNNPNNWYSPTLYEVKVFGDKTP